MKVTKEEKKKIVEGTLKWCNARRKEKGLKPLEKLPKGRRNNGASCPCGEASRVFVGSHTWCEIEDVVRVPIYQREPIPPEVSKFVIEFDKGLLPEYDKDYLE